MYRIHAVTSRRQVGKSVNNLPLSGVELEVVQTPSSRRRPAGASGSCSGLPGSGVVIVPLLVSAAGHGHLSRKDRGHSCRALCVRGHYLLQSARTSSPSTRDRTSFGPPAIHNQCESLLSCLCSECRDCFFRSIHCVLDCGYHSRVPSFARSENEISIIIISDLITSTDTPTRRRRGAASISNRAVHL